jgi:myo-inositol-1(or 4)-monophosphatase
MIDLIKVLDQTKAVAEEAGAFIRKERQFFDVKNVEAKRVERSRFVCGQAG